MAAKPFDSERLILCEGIEDAAFLRQLVRERNLGVFNVRPVGDIGEVSGITGFASALAVAVQTSGFKRIQKILLVADSDEHPGNTFTELCQQITAANADPNVGGLFTVPPAATTFGGGMPRMKILLLPTAQTKGALDSLLWSALKATAAHATFVDCADDACDCAGIATGKNKWRLAKLDKARVRIAIALINKSDPAVALGKLWQQYPGLIPATHAVFNDVAAALVAPG